MLGNKFYTQFSVLRPKKIFVPFAPKRQPTNKKFSKEKPKRKPKGLLANIIPKNTKAYLVMLSKPLTVFDSPQIYSFSHQK